MKLKANCQTTAMGIMPHTDIEQALRLALSVDIPFLPQLPKVSFLEDMYVQTSQNFPGISLDLAGEKIVFSTEKFAQELDRYAQRLDERETFLLQEGSSVTLPRFLETDLRKYSAIRGQLTGPVSLGFRIIDENNKPIIYNEAVRTLLYDFIQRKANVQYRQFKEKNSNAFVWLDEPGLGWVFSGFTGYNDTQAKEDYHDFLAALESLKALHLCANVNLPYLLGLGIELLSFDAYQIGIMPKEYALAVGKFLQEGKIVCWGIVPTDSDNLGRESPETLANLLSGFWEKISQTTGMETGRIAEQALIAPARCCLKNIGRVGAVEDSTATKSQKLASAPVEEKLVELAFSHVRKVSQILRERYKIRL